MRLLTVISLLTLQHFTIVISQDVHLHFTDRNKDQEEEEVLNFETTSSRTCRKDCINLEGNFCVNPEFTRGTCCDWDEFDCGEHSGLCSNDILVDNRFQGLEYWTCPRERFCGDLVQIAQPYAATLTINSDSYENEVLCTYRFQFSINAGPGDVMTVEFTKAEYTGLGFAVGNSYLTATNA